MRTSKAVEVLSDALGFRANMASDWQRTFASDGLLDSFLVSRQVAHDRLDELIAAAEARGILDDGDASADQGQAVPVQPFRGRLSPAASSEGGGTEEAGDDASGASVHNAKRRESGSGLTAYQMAAQLDRALKAAQESGLDADVAELQRNLATCAPRSLLVRPRTGRRLWI